MENIELLIEALKKEGLRFTEQRKSIWDEITSSDDHREAEDIFLSLRKKYQCIKGNCISNNRCFSQK